MRKHLVPMVLLGERIFRGPFDQVAMSNVEAARTATERLISLGRRRIAVICAHPADVTGTAVLRLEGYQAALRDAAVPLDDEPVIEAGLWHRATGADGMHELIDSGTAFDAVWTGHGRSATQRPVSTVGWPRRPRGRCAWSSRRSSSWCAAARGHRCRRSARGRSPCWTRRTTRSTTSPRLVNVIAPIMTEAGSRSWRQTTFHPFARTAAHARGEVLRVECVSLFDSDWFRISTAAAPDAVTPRANGDVKVDSGIIELVLPPVSWTMFRLIG